MDQNLNGDCKFYFDSNANHDSEIISGNSIQSLAVIQSRGCYWGKCTFCDYVNLYKTTKYSEKSVKQLVSEMSNIKTSLGVSKFKLINESLTPQYALELVKELEKNKISMEWGSFIKLDSHHVFSRDLLQQMYEVGCRRLTVGVESIDSKVLRLLGKGYNEDCVRNFFDAIKDIPILFKINLIVDAPPTNIDSALRQIEYFENLLFTHSIFIKCFQFELTKTSRIAKNPNRFGITILDQPIVSKTKGFSDNQLAFNYNEKLSQKEVENLIMRYENINKSNALFFRHGVKVRSAKDIRNLKLKLQLNPMAIPVGDDAESVYFIPETSEIIRVSDKDPIYKYIERSGTIDTKFLFENAKYTTKGIGRISSELHRMLMSELLVPIDMIEKIVDLRDAFNV